MVALETAERGGAEREKRVVAASSVAAAFVLIAMKLAVGVWTGSLGILSEALHSGLDLAAAVVTLYAVSAITAFVVERHLTHLFEADRKSVV